MVIRKEEESNCILKDNTNIRQTLRIVKNINSQNTSVKS